MPRPPTIPGCNSAWSEIPARNREVVGSNPTTQTIALLAQLADASALEAPIGGGSRNVRGSNPWRGTNNDGGADGLVLRPAPAATRFDSERLHQTRSCSSVAEPRFCKP